MAFTPKELLQNHLAQLNDYLGQFKDEPYNSDADQFKRSYENAMRYIKNNNYLAGIPQVKEIHQAFEDIIINALAINQFEDEKMQLRSGKRIGGQHSNNEPIDWKAYTDALKALEEEVARSDVDKMDARLISAPPKEYESHLARNIANMMQRDHERDVKPVRMATRSSVAKPSVVTQVENQPEPVAKKAEPLVMPSIKKPKKVAKTLTQLENERIQKQIFKDRLKELESNIKYYKEFTKSENAGKAEFKRQDVKMAQNSYGEKILHSDNLAIMLKGLVLSEKEQQQYAKRVEVVANDKWAVLAHHEYTKLKQQGWLDPYGVYEHLSIPYEKGDQYSEYIKDVSKIITNINSFLKHHDWVVKSQPGLLAKNHDRFVVKAKEERVDAIKYLERFQEAQKQFEIASELETKINQLSAALQPQAAGKGVLSDRFLEGHKKVLLEKLNALEAPSKLFNGKNRATQLAALQLAVDSIEQEQKKVQSYYDKAKAIYTQTNEFQQNLQLDRNIFTDGFPKNLKAAYLVFVRENVDKKILELIKPDKFSHPDKPADLDNIQQQLRDLESQVTRYNDYFRNAAGLLSDQMKFEKSMTSALENNKKLALKSVSKDLFNVHVALSGDFVRVSAELQSLLASPHTKDATNLAASLAVNSKYTEDYVHQYLTDLSSSRASLQQGVLAFEQAASLFVEINRLQDSLPKASGKHSAAAKQMNSILEDTKKDAIAILQKRPIAVTSADAIVLIIKNLEQKHLPAINALNKAASIQVNNLSTVVSKPLPPRVLIENTEIHPNYGKSPTTFFSPVATKFANKLKPKEIDGNENAPPITDLTKPKK